jgi:hypothetical protein
MDYIDNKSFGEHNRHGKELKTKNKGKKFWKKNNDSRSRYRIVVKARLNKLGNNLTNNNNNDLYILPYIYMITNNYRFIGAHRSKVIK